MKKENYIRIQNRIGMSNHEFLDSIHGFYYGVAVALILIILLATITGCGVNDNQVVFGNEQIYPVGNQSGFNTTTIDPFLANYPDFLQGPITLFSIAGNRQLEHNKEIGHGRVSESITLGDVADTFQ